MTTLVSATHAVTDRHAVTEPITQEPDRIVIFEGRALRPDPVSGLIPPAPPRPLVDVRLETATATISPRAGHGVFHYLRQSDATLIPLPPEHAENGHKLVAWKLDELGIFAGQAARLSLRRGDAYVAVTPGAARLTEGTTIARFVHLRDYFNAERLAQALAEEICAGRLAVDISAAFTVLVIEAR